jgi:hypothetical protein
MDVVCKWCQREVRANKLLGHYTTHAVEWSLGAKSDIKQYCLMNKKPLMYEFGKQRNTIPWVVCLACHKFKTINTSKFITDHKCDCVWERYEHLYKSKDIVISATTDCNTTALLVENEELKDKLRNLEIEVRQLRNAMARMDAERYQSQQQFKTANEIKMEPVKYSEPVKDSEPDWDWKAPEKAIPKPVNETRVATVGNEESLRRILVSLEHIVEEWMPYKEARYEYEELVDELEPNNLGKPYDLLRDYIRDDCTREDLEAFLRSYVS